MPRRPCGAWGRGLRKCSQTRDRLSSRVMPSILQASRAGGKSTSSSTSARSRRHGADVSRQAPVQRREHQRRHLSQLVHVHPRQLVRAQPDERRSAHVRRQSAGFEARPAPLPRNRTAPRQAIRQEHHLPATALVAGRACTRVGRRRRSGIVHGVNRLRVRPFGLRVRGMLLEGPVAGVWRRREVVRRHGIDDGIGGQIDDQQPGSILLGVQVQQDASVLGQVAYRSDSPGPPAGTRAVQGDIARPPAFGDPQRSGVEASRRRRLDVRQHDVTGMNAPTHLRRYGQASGAILGSRRHRDCRPGHETGQKCDEGVPP